MQQLIKLLQEISLLGHESYIIGGAVRAYLREMPLSDVDIVTSAKAADLIPFYEISNVNQQFLSFKISIENRTIDVTTMRTETYQKPFFPKTDNTDKLFLDLKRRDYTINSILIDLNGKLIDPFAGITALQNHELIVIGDVNQKFQDDPLRILRGLRLAADYDLKISNHIFESMIEYKSYLNLISKQK